MTPDLACGATRHPIGCLGSLPCFQVKASPHLEQLSDSLNLRLTREQKDGLMAAVRHTPGAASPSGVARHAIDEYLERVLRRPSPSWDLLAQADPTHQPPADRDSL